MPEITTSKLIANAVLVPDTLLLTATTRINFPVICPCASLFSPKLNTHYTLHTTHASACKTAVAKTGEEAPE